MIRKYIVASLFVLGAVGVWSCGPGEPAAEEVTAEVASVPEPVVEPAPVAEPMPEVEPAVANAPMTTAELSPGQFWEETVWVAGKEGELVLGLDEGEYDPYSISTVQQVQQALASEGLYSGLISGVLDQATMQAIGEFQKANNLQVCGVPTPRTRAALLQR